MAYTDTAKNLMLTELGTVAVYVSLHTGDPGTTGTNEVTGGSPAYARQQLTWDAAATGSMAMAAAETFDVPAATVSHFGLWSAVTAGTFYGGGALSASEVFAAQGEYELTTLTIDLNS